MRIDERRDAARVAARSHDRRLSPAWLAAATTALLAIPVCLALGGCGDQVQKVKPPEKPPAKADAGGLPSGHPDIGHGGMPQDEVHGAADPFAEASDAGKPAMAAGQSEDPERVVLAGEIALDPAVTVGGSYVVYVLAVFGRDEKAPVLVKRYESPKFPLPFELKEKDSGMGARKSDRPLYVRAMISDTGDVMNSRNRTTSEQAYPLFTKDVKLTIKP